MCEYLTGMFVVGGFGVYSARMDVSVRVRGMSS